MAKGKGMSSALRKATPRPEHKERSQPARRARFGLLEKHKDYVVRAKSFHVKEKRLRALKEKAALRNPDEFYFKMVQSKTKDGVHKIACNNGLPMDTVKILKSQDRGYVTMKSTAEAKKVRRLSRSLAFVGVEKPKQHIIFVENEEQENNFDPATHFDTHPDLVDRHFNRPRMNALRDQSLVARRPSKKDLNKIEKAKANSYLELSERAVRDSQLKTWMQDMDLQAQSMVSLLLRLAALATSGDCTFEWLLSPISLTVTQNCRAKERNAR
jgi:U3 small nucleolar RNA-associated protein 11